MTTGSQPSPDAVTESMKRPVRIFLKVVGWSVFVVVVLAVAALITGLIIHNKYEVRAANYDLQKISRFSQRSSVFDVNGELYSHLDGENRFVVSLPRVAKSFVQALLAREDSRFWEHTGVDFHGVARAAWTNFRSGDVKQGASTITQQLARNSLELTGRTMDRKILEAVIARRIERSYSKEQVLEYYVNRIYFGSGFYGIEAAARGYFGKSASDLTLGESALLAGLIRSPNRFSPIRDLTGALNERDTVLERMLELKMITEAEFKTAEAARITVTSRRAMRFAEDQVMDAITRELEWYLAPDVINFGGLRIYVTIDPQLQRLAESATERQLAEIEESKGFPHPKKADFVAETSAEGVEKPTDYLQAAMVAIDNRTGAIRAIVGSRDYAQSKYSRALLSKRQIGSTFKPFVYAAAYQRGLLPGTLIDDSKIGPGELRNVSKVKGKEWSPENSDGEYEGLQPAAFGLLKSRNTMTVRIGELVGLPAVREVANRAGIGETMPDYPVATLGAFETTVRDITSAYTVFPNHGVLKPSYLIARVEDDAGHILYQAELTERRVLNPDTSWMVSATLQDIMKTGTASKSAALGWKKPGGGKTGTTNDFFDAWFVGYSSTLTCGVWVGMDKPQTIMPKGYGSALALPLWVDFMRNAPEKAYPAEPLPPPLAMVKVRLCSTSGSQATSRCEEMRLGYEAVIPSSRVPNSACRLHPEPPPPAAIYAAQPGYPGSIYQAPAPALARSLPQLSQYPQQAALPGTRGTTAPPVVASAPAPVIAAALRPVTVERTASGLLIYGGGIGQGSGAPVSSPRPSAPVEVRRASPVDRASEEEEVVPERRVLRAEPVTRSQDLRQRVVRGRVVDDEDL